MPIETTDYLSMYAPAIIIAIVMYIFSATFAILCALIADKKGHNPLGWLFAGFFLNIIAFIVLNFIRNKS